MIIMCVFILAGVLFGTSADGLMTAETVSESPSSDLFSADFDAIQDVNALSEELSEESIEDLSYSISSGDADSSGIVLMESSDVQDMIQLLASDSATVNGYMSTAILDMMDRIIDGYSSGCKYIGYRTSADDSYNAVLYVGRKASVNGNTVTLTGDVKQVTFSRSGSNYSYVPYYDVTDISDATVSIGYRAIVYTNTIEAYPTLGSPIENHFSVALPAVIIGVVLMAVLLKKRVY